MEIGGIFILNKPQKLHTSDDDTFVLLVIREKNLLLVVMSMTNLAIDAVDVRQTVQSATYRRDSPVHHVDDLLALRQLLLGAVLLGVFGLPDARHHRHDHLVAQDRAQNGQDLNQRLWVSRYAG